MFLVLRCADGVLNCADGTHVGVLMVSSDVMIVPGILSSIDGLMGTGGAWVPLVLRYANGVLRSLKIC